MRPALPYLALIATAAFVLSPLVTDPFSGFDPDRFPLPQTEPPVQPAGYAFSIWGLIYLWLAVSALFGVMARRADAGWQRMRLPLIVSLGPGAAWLWVAGISPIWATVLIFWMLGFAVLAMLRAPQTDRWLAQAPVAIYAGWLTAAAHVSLGVSMGGFGLAPPDIAAVLCLTLAAGVALTILHYRADLSLYGAAVIWAVFGVLVANLGGSIMVQIAAVVALGLVGLAIARGLWAGQRARGL
ncbi:MAG: hypothetical protein JJT99_06825 [Rhodobacteraceae bacterium]|nr:hypothetical protein [Paracoccaceae bacterium]